MNFEHVPEVRESHLCKGLVAQNAGVVDQNIYATPSFHDAIDHRSNLRLVRDGRGDSHRLAAPRADLVGDARRRRLLHVVDDDLRAVACQHQSVGASQPTTCTPVTRATRARKLMFSSTTAVLRILVWVNNS